MDDHLWRRTIEFFLLAGMAHLEGELPDIHNIAWRLRSTPEEILEALTLLERLDITHQNDDGTWVVTNFSDRQRKREPNERSKNYRERKRIEEGRIYASAGELTQRTGVSLD